MRIAHDEAMMAMAYICALRGTCVRRLVGAVITDEDRHVLSTGYNGVPQKALHCTDSPCPGALQTSGEGLDMCHALHAEQNAIAHCTDLSKARYIYTTTQPCMNCIKQLIATPIRTIVFDQSYPHEEAVALWKTQGTIYQHEPTSTVLTGLRMEAAFRASELKERALTWHRYGDKRPKPN